jgi:integrase
MQSSASNVNVDAAINLKGLHYADKLWTKYFNNHRQLGNGLTYKLKKAGFFNQADPNERLRVALDVLETYSMSTAERYFAHLKYGGYIQLPEIKNLFLAKEHYGSSTRRAPQIRIPSIDQYHNFVGYLYNQLKIKKDQKLSTNPLLYDKELGAIILILLVCNTGLRLSEVLRLTTKHLRELLDGHETIEIKMKTSSEWKVIRHKSLYYLLTQMDNIYEHFWTATGQQIIELLLFQFGREYIRTEMKKIFKAANNNNAPPNGFGLHTIRYYIASQFAQTNLKLAQMVLNHKNINTTAVYVRYKTLKLQHALIHLEELSPLIIAAKQQILP